jgi:hypothetical protein
MTVSVNMRGKPLYMNFRRRKQNGLSRLLLMPILLKGLERHKGLFYCGKFCVVMNAVGELKIARNGGNIISNPHLE